MSGNKSSLKEYKELQRIKQMLNQQMTIGAVSQSISPNKLPSIRSQRVKPRLDRYATERIKYQNNLTSVMADIRAKMELDNTEELLALKPRFYKNRAFRTLRSLKGDDMTVKTMSLSPKKDFGRIDIEPPLKRRNSPRKVNNPQEQTKGKQYKLDLFNCQPWQTIDDAQLYNCII